MHLTIFLQSQNGPYTGPVSVGATLVVALFNAFLNNDGTLSRQRTHRIPRGKHNRFTVKGILQLGR